MKKYNLLLDVDSYKVGHWKMYPHNTKVVNSYIESRGSKAGNLEHVPIPYGTIFYGLQDWIRNVLYDKNGRAFTKEDINEADKFYANHLGDENSFNRSGWYDLYSDYNGHLPITIEAPKEGMPIDIGNVLVQVKNTDKKYAWLTNYLETSILRAVWYPTTVATISWYAKHIINHYLELTCDNEEEKLIEVRLHDFGSRGVSSYESAFIGGKAHLLSFKGTDTSHAAFIEHEFPLGFSINASEHSTITSWSKDNEFAAYENMINKYKGKMFACVCDSYNIFDAVKWWVHEDRQSDLYTSSSTVVIRPDSGDPVKITEEIFEIMWESLKPSDSKKNKRMSGRINKKGFRVLPKEYKIIQGDGIDLNMMEQILQNFYEKKICASNISFGMGGGLLQKCDRDTFMFAMKCSATKIGDKWNDVYKDPITDQGKKSKKGVLALTYDGEKYVTLRKDSLGYSPNLLETVYENGKIMREQTFEDIRNKTWIL